MSKSNRRKDNVIAKRISVKEKMNWFNSIKELHELRKNTLALKEMEKYLQTYPDDEFARILYGKILTSLKEFDMAKDIYENLADRGTEKVKYSAMYYVACIEKKEGNYKEAKKLLQTAIEESPYEEPLSKIQLAEIERDCSNFDEAERILKTVEEEFIDLVKIELVKIKLLRGKKEEALEIINTIEESKKDNFNTKLNLEKGRVAMAFEDYKLAKEYFNIVLKGPKTSSYYLALGEIANIENKVGNYDEAIRICQSLLGISDGLDGELSLILGKAYEGKEKIEQAREYYHKVLKHKSFRRQQKATMLLGRLEFKSKNYDKAEEYLKEIENSYYDNQAVLFMLIFLNIKKVDYEVADYYLEKIYNKGYVNKTNRVEFNSLKILIYKNLGRNIEIDESSYTEKQCLNYSKEDAINHIKSEHYNNFNKKSKFSLQVNIEEVIDDIKIQMTDETLDSIGVMDTYLIKYKDAGYTIDQEVSDWIKVVAIANTKDIITMYPVLNNQKKVNKIEKGKQKQLSRIEKFNQKYNLK